ncbi:MAG: hypothetical protein ACR2QJ_07735, partial [Geminicoccaceae bacterium]
KPMDKRGLESDEFKEKLASERFHPEKLSAWLSLEQPVPANVQDRILLAMDRPMPVIFTDTMPDTEKA